MKRKGILILLSVFIYLITSTSQAYTKRKSELVFDSTAGEFPKNFRSTFFITDLKEDTLKTDKHYYAGGGQFDSAQLAKIAAILGKSLIVVDLRQEPHGFVNGLPISWYAVKNWANVNKTPDLIMADEQTKLAALKKKSMATVNKIIAKSDTGFIEATQSILVTVKTVMTEQKLVEQMGLKYQRFYITDHQPPSDYTADKFIVFIKNLPDDANLYFHCRAGRGRTTIFMLMYAIMRTAKNTSLATILRQQIAIGGKDIQALPPINSYKYAYSIKRKEFIQNFYNYVKYNQDNFKTSWSDWKDKHKNQLS